jgi:5-methylcytosine-specific restriction endonuclease McrBC regulatory subunit McrC
MASAAPAGRRGDTGEGPRSALLARLILQERSAEHHRGRVRATGFLLDLNQVFQDYMAAAIGERLCRRSGKVLS